MQVTQHIITWPVSLEVFKAHLRMKSSEFDSDLQLKLNAATRAAEMEIADILAKRENVATTAFSSVVNLPEEPIEVISVEIDGVLIDIDKYTVVGSAVRLDSSVSGSEIIITYHTGLKDPDKVDDDIKAAILLIASSFWRNPVDSVEQLPKASQNLLKFHRKWPKNI